MSSDAPASKRDRKRDLRADENFAETLLPHAAGGAAAAFLQRVDDIGARALQRRIKSHGQTGEERKRDREGEHRKRKRGRAAGFDRQKIRRQLRHERDQLPGEQRTENSREQADQHAFENEQTEHARARRAERHAQRNLAPPPAEPNEK